MVLKHADVFKTIYPVLESKREELSFYGYDTVTSEAIWTFCLKKLWKNQDIEQIPLHKLTNDVFQISPSAFMMFTQIEEQRNSNWFSDVNADELDMLLGSRKVPVTKQTEAE